VHEAIALLKRRGIEVDYLRVRAFPFGAEVEQFLATHETLFVIEQNRDAQLKSLLILETAVDKARLRSILHYSGLPLAANVIVDGVLAALPNASNLRVVRALESSRSP
jgi:2-oxoglutarate/2-oxoacid ferredoxin oxidoreductase subunit alpha